MPGQKIPGRGPLGWTIVVLLMGAALGLAIHVPDSAPHDFAITGDTTPTTADLAPTETTRLTTTTVETAPSTTSTLSSATTAAPPVDNVLVGNTLIVVSATQDGADYPIQSRLTISFRQVSGGQSASWTGGCNSIGAPVVIHANTIDVGQITSTAVGCPSPVGDEENFLTALMQSNPHWDLQSGLVVLEGGGRRIVTNAFG